MRKTPSRLAALQTHVVASIKPGSLAKIEAMVADQLTISATPAEVSNLLMIIAKNHPDDFIGSKPEAPKRDMRIEPSINDVGAMSAADKLAWANKYPGTATLAALAAKKTTE